MVVCLVMGLVMLVVGITSASLTCRPLCCPNAVQGAVHYSPTTALPPGLLHTLQVASCPWCTMVVTRPPQAPPAAVQVEGPPAYQEVAGGGDGRYHKL